MTTLLVVLVQGKKTKQRRYGFLVSFTDTLQCT